MPRLVPTDSAVGPVSEGFTVARLDRQERRQIRISTEPANHLHVLAEEGVHKGGLVNLEDKGFFEKSPRDHRHNEP